MMISIFRMQLQNLQFLTVQLLLLFLSNTYVQSAFILSQSFPSIESNLTGTNELILESQSFRCLTDKDCFLHSYCDDGDCLCEKGWITWRDHRQCSYKQSSKILTFIISFMMGCMGIDWFLLSRRDSLYILCGILKLLVCVGCCIWNPLAASSKSRTAATTASCLSITLTLISFIWWFVDWIRILLNSFPDGNGASLI
ncbi:hypothetical protein I4U23_028358 [Adineta vaga]|nr:hypothetical protein I4U23_028358 [Adineta vaga]